jgi:hypothetical protein
MYIKKLVIENIRSITRFEMNFPKPAGWHVLIGDNGSGKSSVVRAIAAALIGPEQITVVAPLWNEWLREGSDSGKIELEILPDLKLDNILNDVSLPSKTIVNLFALKRNKGDYISLNTNAGNNENNPLNYNWGKNDGWFSVAYGPYRRLTGGEEKRNKIYYAYPKAASHLSAFGEEVALTEALDWLKELDRMRLKLKEINQSNLLQEPNGVFRTESEWIFDFFKLFINKSGLLPHNETFDSINIDGDVIFRDSNGNSIKVTQLSDGYRSVLSLMFDLIRQLVKTYSAKKVFENLIKGKKSDITIPLPGVVLIDEIDTHLHPSWQTRIGQWFTKYFPKMQFIVTTHSPLICRACEKGTIWRLAAPGSDKESILIKGDDRNRLIFGNVLDAYGTDVFGKAIAISKEGNEKRNRLGELNIKSIMGEKVDENELQELKKIFPTEKITTK